MKSWQLCQRDDEAEALRLEPIWRMHREPILPATMLSLQVPSMFYTPAEAAVEFSNSAESYADHHAIRS